MEFYKVRLEFKAKTPIFASGEPLAISAGEYIVGTRKYTPVRITYDNRVLIPLKGRLRYAAEEILKEQGYRICNLDEDLKGCGSCLACDIFGSTKQRGRWLVGNLISKDFATDITKIYPHIKVKRESHVVDPKKIFNTQEIEAGAEFVTEVIINNPNKGKINDIELLRACAKALEVVGVGGFMSKGYGRLELINMKKEKYSSLSEFTGFKQD